nr:MAG TPA: hypothetical protein [Caudoviricetes sp.]
MNSIKEFFLISYLETEFYIYYFNSSKEVYTLAIDCSVK